MSLKLNSRGIFASFATLTILARASAYFRDGDAAVDKRAIYLDGEWTLEQSGQVPCLSWLSKCQCFFSTTGVSAVELIIVTETTALILDKVYVFFKCSYMP
jgi:hypothetical protein